MEQERRSIRIGLAAIICAVFIQLLSSGVPQAVAAFLTTPEAASFILYLETGRVFRITGAETQPQPTQETEEPTQPQPEQPQQEDPEPQRAVFSAEDATLLKVQNNTRYPFKAEQWLTQPLNWDLTQEEPTVLILHTHTTESYTQTEGYDYQESSKYRCLDEDYNMNRVGSFLAQLLRQQGISVLHDTTIHDYPSYTGSYNASRKTAQAYLEEYPSICLILDLHRDALETQSGKQLSTHTTVNGVSTAQLMLVVGTDAGGLKHPQWEQNMALAVKLHAQLEKNAPGICRPISFRSQRFNQDLCPGTLLVEVGAAGDSFPEALAAAQILAQAITDLAQGAESADSTS